MRLSPSVYKLIEYNFYFTSAGLPRKYGKLPKSGADIIDAGKLYKVGAEGAQQAKEPIDARGNGPRRRKTEQLAEHRGKKDDGYLFGIFHLTVLFL